MLLATLFPLESKPSDGWFVKSVGRRTAQATKNPSQNTRGWLPGTGFDAYPWRQPVTESSHINSLANHPYRSTVKTLPATLPEPWAVVRGQCLAVKASWLSPLGRRTRGYWGWLRDLDRIGSRGGAKVRGDLRLGPRVGDGWAEVVESDFDWACCEVQTLTPQPNFTCNNNYLADLVLRQLFCILKYCRVHCRFS